MWTEVERRLKHLPRRRMGEGRPQAGVLIAITRNESEPHLILTQRASTLSTHGGEVAFPGGKRDPEDDSLLATALREAEEEIGLSPDAVTVLGIANPVISRWGLQVTPVIGLVDAEVPLRINDAEIASVFRVPLSFFMKSRPSRIDEIDLRGIQAAIPCWHYEGYEIWGLTAYLLAEFLNLAFDAKFALYSTPSNHQK
ncbi:CoA pyrophosphatase [Pokkaliibacter sp. CJK22405]|uniref:CoA pyrophosphatase n=1 Tax=Pokkaliibacter sp. CJK22405 TaxID=3384615 RepID=UPI0039849F41